MLELKDPDMEEIKEHLIKKAQSRHGDIRPCGRAQDFFECFTTNLHGDLVFWYNTPDDRTHIIINQTPDRNPN